MAQYKRNEGNEEELKNHGTQQFFLALGILGGIFFLLVISLIVVFLSRPRGTDFGNLEATNAVILTANAATAKAATLEPMDPTITAEVTPDPSIVPTVTTSVGKYKLTHPIEMVVDSNDVITVEILVKPDTTSIQPPPLFSPSATTVVFRYSDGSRVEFKDNLRIYPEMAVELVTSGFELDQEDGKSPWFQLSNSHPLRWSWNIKASQPGVHELTINFYGRATGNEEEAIFSEMSKTTRIEVIEKPVITRFNEGVLRDLPVIIGIVGPLGLLIASLVLKMGKDNEKHRKTMDKHEKNIGDLEMRIKELEKLVQR